MTKRKRVLDHKERELAADIADTLGEFFELPPPERAESAVFVMDYATRKSIRISGKSKSALTIDVVIDEIPEEQWPLVKETLGVPPSGIDIISVETPNFTEASEVAAVLASMLLGMNLQKTVVVIKDFGGDPPSSVVSGDDLDKAVSSALETMMILPSASRPFVVVTDMKTRKFVQFYGSASEPLTIDIPSHQLTPAGMAIVHPQLTAQKVDVHVPASLSRKCDSVEDALVAMREVMTHFLSLPCTGPFEIDENMLAEGMVN